MSKRALVWGANGGIGRALVHELLTQGWQVVAVARHFDRPAKSGEVQIEADVCDAAGVQAAVLSAAQEVGEIDLWVYTVGDIQITKVQELAPATWERIVAANLTGAYLTTHYSRPLLATQAHLFYLGAVSERLKLPGFAAYVAAKAGLEAFVEVLVKEERELKVTLIRPGAVNTSFWRKVPLRMPKNALEPAEVIQRILAAYHEGRTGSLYVGS